jgi:uncharacterized protein (TIGR02600 family)
MDTILVSTRNRSLSLGQLRRRHRLRSSATLIIVLASLALVMILLVAFLQTISFQSGSSQSASTLAREKMLADTAAALVIGQIEQASTQADQAWISQPTYGVSATRQPTACYKLYSTASVSNLVDTSGNLDFFTNDIPSDWNSTAKSSLYTDLNEPAQTSSGQTIYPILDPLATNLTGISIDAGSTVQMPVAWLYELQDGTLGPASSGTIANPIVARLAFWTDDDTSKINLNTAGDGTGWNTPHANSTDDVVWSTNQPAMGEYSSYPGHPATTSLASVLGTNYSPQQLLALTPRYAWGGSEFGTQTTTPGEIVPPKADRLYPTLDEFCFSSSQTAEGQRQTNAVSASQIEIAQFVLTAHSQAPETTLLGEPRIAIWPVADSTTATAPRITAADSAITNAATVGLGTTSIRSYYFQRNNPLSTNDDFNPSQTSSSPATASNLQLFNDLVTARGNASLPGYGTSFANKYTGASWTQLMLEVTDFIHGLNAVDPSPAPFVPFAPSNASGLGRGFVEPLTYQYGAGASAVTLRGLGRCPTLSSLTLVFYVSGFGFSAQSKLAPIDFDGMSNSQAASAWNQYFLPGSSSWKNVTSELVRCFVVPCTYQPGCGYPEVSDACKIQINGLNNMKVSCEGSASNFGFAASATSPILGAPLQTLAADRAWGGNDGPLVWREIGDSLASGGTATYPFAGASGTSGAWSIPITVTSTASPPAVNFSWTSATMTFAALNGVTVVIQDDTGNPLQTLSINLPTFSVHAPTNIGECDHADGSTPATANAGWITNTSSAVLPCYYMSLRNRLLATQNNRAMMIQPGDVSRGIDATTDWRVVGGLVNVPATTFVARLSYSSNGSNSQDGSSVHNLHFADGTAIYGAVGYTTLVAPNVPVPTTTPVSWNNWINGTPIHYAWTNGPPSSVATTDTAKSVSMSTNSIVPGDWDTGPGFAPDGALIDLPDAGTSVAPATAYFSLAGGLTNAPTQRTPNALVPSPVIFGSLPAGINPTNPAASQPWRTLLFCPYPAANTSSTPYAFHPGAASPPDYLILDNFWMPTVEPYAISGCMTTAGKINLNDQIAPFTWLHRNTALHALLTDLRIPAIPDAAAAQYKTAGTPLTSIWKTVNEDATIAQIENRFAAGSVDAYLSESEICAVPLVPNGVPGITATSSVAANQTALQSFWNGNAAPGGLTGDNLRELPYAQLYSRLTARSNSYTVHLRVQVLKKLTSDPHQNVWNEGTDLVIGEWRGSYEIERYLDPAAPAPVAGQSLGPYKFRIISARQFAP